MGYELKKIQDDFIIVDSNERIGDCWRKRWDSLKLFTPAQYDGLPGFPFPAARGSFPNRNEMADFLENYARTFSLPVLTNSTVYKLSKNSSAFSIRISSHEITAERVIVATGTHPVPKFPAFSKDMDKSILQIHSSQYRNPQMILFLALQEDSFSDCLRTMSLPLIHQ
jgi:putative flavoprotein involved in K+ transport